MTRLKNRLTRTAQRLAVGFAATAAAAVLVAPLALATPESDAADAISAAWDAAGGSDSAVGSQDGDVYQVGDGYGQKFTDGKIFFTPDSGAHPIFGAILGKYESLGGPGDSDLGFPTIDEVEGLAGPDSRVSTFSASDKPAIFWTPDTGAWAVRGAINAAWDKLGGSAGTLGPPIEDERYNGDAVSQKFTGGELTWNLATETFTSTPAELADTLTGLEVPSDATTLINLAWRASGGLGGPLGARQGEQSTIGDTGAAQGYAGGKIFYSPRTGAKALTGAILSKYESVGGATGDLGYPIGTESDGGVPNSRISSFGAPDKPVIFWTPDTGAIVVRGAISAAWSKLGGATGTLGTPTGEPSVSGDTITQTFSGGEISWNQATKEFSTSPADLASSLSGLELPDAVAQTPAGTAPGDASGKSGWRSWWLLLIPLVLLLGSLSVWALRKSGPAGVETDDHWPGSPLDSGRESGYPWSAPGVDEADRFDADEDTIDTAPTRIPTEAELAEFDRADRFDAVETEAWEDDVPADSGRHSVFGGAESAWTLDLDETGWPRHRRAAPEPPDWVGEIDEVEAIEVEPVEDEPDDSWRPAIHLPLADPYQAPEGYWIKGNTHSGLYYTPDSELYDNTVPEVWFASEDMAQANGFVKAPE
ncbi:MAG: LGFP repeat-containing protein [Mycobacterium sp.]